MDASWWRGIFTQASYLCHKSIHHAWVSAFTKSACSAFVPFSLNQMWPRSPLYVKCIHHVGMFCTHPILRKNQMSPEETIVIFMELGMPTWNKAKLTQNLRQIKRVNLHKLLHSHKIWGRSKGSIYISSSIHTKFEADQKGQST